jgi:hypothetical protein
MAISFKVFLKKNLYGFINPYISKVTYILLLPYYIY